MAAALLFLGLLLYLSLMWRSGIREEVDKDADQVLENAVLRLDNILEGAERTARVLSWFVIRDLDQPDMMVAHANNTIRYDQQLTSCSISSRLLGWGTLVSSESTQANSSSGEAFSGTSKIARSISWG